jgi:hypothetical protein
LAPVDEARSTLILNLPGKNAMTTRQLVGKPATRDERGRFGKGNQLGPGRPKGSKDKYPQADSIKAVYES